MTNALEPTPYPEVNAVLRALLAGVQTILGRHFVGMYLYGSLASGGFDEASDVDFLVVTDEEVAGAEFAALQALHERIARLDSWCATQLEGSYISQFALRRFHPARGLHPHIDRGTGERLKMLQHDRGRIVELHILREQGVIVTGPAPSTLIDPIAPDELRQVMRELLNWWLALMLGD